MPESLGYSYQIPEMQPSPTGFTPEYASHLDFWSYPHAQFNTQLQKNIHQFVHIIRPSYHMSDQLMRQTLLLTLAKLGVFHKEAGSFDYEQQGVISHASMRGFRIGEEATLRLKDMQEALNNESDTPSRESVLRQIAIRIIKKDCYYIVENKNGRPRLNIEPDDAYGDQHLSYLVYFGYLGNSTGIAEFDEMYRDLNQYLHSIRPRDLNGIDEDIDARWNAVVEKYNETHPKVQIKW